MDLEHSIVGWNRLKSDVCMPSYTRISRGIGQLMRESTTLLLLLTGDDTDLISQFTTFFGQWMDMEPRAFRLELSAMFELNKGIDLHIQRAL